MGEVQDTLNDLIAVCRDSEKGFGKAAKDAHGDNLRRRFTGIAQQRADFAGELAAYVRKMGAEPADSGPQGGINRGWRDLETSIPPKDDASFLAQCETGEEDTLLHYERALARDLPAPVRPMVDRQRLGVQETLLELRSLEQVRRAS
jgi:uncharacterized protein (TIGR02284 family)